MQQAVVDRDLANQREVVTEMGQPLPIPPDSTETGGVSPSVPSPIFYLPPLTVAQVVTQAKAIPWQMVHTQGQSRERSQGEL